ncbi:MAG: GntR family transcriptional regulator [Acidimicrobiales bacterium]|jgi:DNA-binding GntR family transcriptional regulator
MSDWLPALGQAPRRVLSDNVLDELRAVIVSGGIEAGQRLRENELASQMNVSRGPVREALVRLEQEGLVALERHRGARVVVLSRDDREKLYRLRRALEELAGEYACSNATEADFDRANAVIEEFVRSENSTMTPAAAAAFDIRFHDSIYIAAHNDPLYRAWAVLRSQVHYFMTTRMMLRPDYNETWEREHMRLLELLRERKKTPCRKFIGLHVEGSFRRILLDQLPDDSEHSAEVAHASR